MEDEYLKLIKVLKIEDYNPRLRFINPNLVNNDRVHYQRFIVQSRVEHLVKHFHETDAEKMIGVVAMRPDGSPWIINSQHHGEAACRMGITSLEYLIFDSTGPTLEEAVFSRFQEWQQKEKK